MEPSDKQLLFERVIRGLLLFIIMGTVIWFLPQWILSLPTTHLSSTQNVSSTSFNIDALLKEIPEPAHNEDIYKEIHFLTYLLDDPRMQAQTLKEQLQEQNIESYLLSVDEMDFDLYIYHEGILHYRILFIQKITEVLIPDDQKPMIAVVIGGLGHKNHSDLITHPTPLTLAFSPIAPFSASLSHQAGKHWHEIVVDARTLPSIKNPNQTLPFSSGILYTDVPKETSDSVSILYPSKGKGNQQAHPLALTTRVHIDVPIMIQRAKKKALQNGFAGILIEAKDPQLNLLLDWTKKAKEEGILFVMTSELRYRQREQIAEVRTAPE